MLDNLNLTNGNDIDIHKLMTELKNIGSEKGKDEFIKNYSKIKEQIKIVDTILFNNNDTDDKNNKNITNEFELNNINELFNILETNEDKIVGSANLNVGELKVLMKICNILEKKINDETINIIEIK